MSLLTRGLEKWFSPAQLARLRAARVGIAGSGGLGSNVALALVRSGIGRLLVVDADHVEASNLNRQAFWPEDVGRPKVLALRDRLLALEPELEYECRQEWLCPTEAPAIFAGCDLVVEALDEASLKADLCTALLKASFFVIAASGIAGYGLAPLGIRRLGERFICVGDFTTGASGEALTLAPRVLQAAAMQADAVLAVLLGCTEERKARPII